ncbi:MAG TPA: undecaprenyl/decaprenyl-phosphate alpha-N-acetylglucosaminyl 1-phosphate transferase [Candidatus Dormibacteraeota bacterium]|nr:undecaprenyl/decaprenyl-phosphate alpha-N-acetylglucosaminyl 1-phosphate transferase [Candidatus Dormibacteraeota bacterium]
MTFSMLLGDAVLPIAVSFIAAALIALGLTPWIKRLVLRYEVVDHPEERRVNTSPIPRGGGLAVATSFIVVAALSLVFNQATGRLPVPFLLDDQAVAALLVGGAAAAALGAIDDLVDLRARWQLLGQIALGIFAVVLGISIGFIANPVGAGKIEFDGLIAAAFTVFWIVGMINSINFIDGLDGLSSGIAFIAAVTLGIISLTSGVGQPLVAVLCFTLAGALLGFLRWNLHPASIFIGTSGVQFVGYTLALLSILGTAKVAVALLVLGVPIIDTFWIIVRRLSQGRSPFSPDRGHIHHRLLDLGLSHRQTVFVIYGICLGLAVLALVLSGVDQLYAFIGVFLASGLVLFIPTRGALRRPEELEAESYEGPDGAAPPRRTTSRPGSPGAMASPTATGQPSPVPTAVPAAPVDRERGRTAPDR